MSKYRGNDGWLHDDNVGKPQRYKNSEDTNPPKRTPKKFLNKCPNCGLHVTWRRLEHRCTACNWGRKDSKHTPTEASTGCCFFAGITIVLPLVGAGIGQGLAGFGGLLAGFGLGISVPIGIFFIGLLGLEKKEKKEKESS